MLAFERNREILSREIFFREIFPPYGMQIPENHQMLSIPHKHLIVVA